MSPNSANSPFRDMRRWMHASMPVNKGTGPSGDSPRLPQIGSPLLIGAIGLGALGAGVAIRAMRPARRGGRRDRFTGLVFDIVNGARPAQAPARDVHVEVGEGFGKPSLVTVDVVISPGDEAADPAHAVDLLDAVVRGLWNNTEMAPVAVRARILLAKDEAADEESREVADMTVLDFDDETARPADLFARYGAPASDPTWRP